MHDIETPVKIIMLSSYVEANGKTIKENNTAIKHSIPIGTLVEIETGVRLFILKHHRDCDGTPLYSIGIDEEDSFSNYIDHGYLESSFKVIK